MIIRAHDWKRGVGYEAHGLTDPAIISRLLHHKEVMVGGNRWAAGQYLCDKYKKINEVRGGGSHITIEKRLGWVEINEVGHGGLRGVAVNRDWSRLCGGGSQ